MEHQLPRLLSISQVRLFLFCGYAGQLRHQRGKQPRVSAQAWFIAAPYEMGGGWIATLADPDGNYFQLVTPMG